MLGLLIVWNAWAFMPHKSVAVPLPYSEFVSQVASGNVTTVSIVGAAITGVFAHPVTWPPPKTTPSSKSSQPSSKSPQPSSKSAQPSSKSAQPSSKAPSRLIPNVPPRSTEQAAKPQHYSRLSTTYPSEVGDPALMPLLRAHHVTIDVQSPSPPWLALLITNGLPIVLMVAVLVWMGRRASRSQSGMFGFARNRARRYTEDRPSVTFADVGGADEAKQDLREVVDFLSHPAKYLAIGARIPRGVLLVGPPGTGKTLLARAVAGEAAVPYFHISGSEFVEMFVGVGASRVRDLFSQAKAAQPAIDRKSVV